MMASLRDVYGDIPVTVAESGVLNAGHVRAHILPNLNVAQLFLIDPYALYDDMPDFYTSELLAEAKNKAMKALSSYSHIIRWVMLPVQMLKDAIPDEYFDIVYLDDNHQFFYVQKAIEVVYPMVKSGGYLGGDDYLNQNVLGHPIGVKKAVDRFVREHGLALSTGCRDSRGILDWWVRKLW